MAALFEQQLLEVTRSFSLWEAVRKSAQEVLRKCKFTGKSPDLRRLATDLGVTEIRVADIPYDGVLVPRTDGTYHVWLSNQCGWSRQRFSLAHELGHIVLHRLLPETRGGLETRTLFNPPGNRVEERFCNAFAAEILMPAGSFQLTALGHVDIDVAVIKKLAKVYGVSLSAAARRYAELAPGDPFALVQFCLDPETRCARVFRILQNFSMCKLSLAQTPTCRADEWLSRGLFDDAKTRGWIWLSEGTHRRKLFVELESPSGKGGRLAVLRPRPSACVSS